jgi:four helix bundle protein
MNSSPQNKSQHPGNAVRPRTTIFDHEKLNVYQSELQFIAWVTPLIEEARQIAIGKTREVCDQLDRASLSALLNTAEGNGKRQGQVRAKFFDDARGSATECAACLHALVAKKVFEMHKMEEGKALLLQIVAMLCGLVDRFDGLSPRLHEEPVEYKVQRIPDDDENRMRKRMRKRKRKIGIR